MKNGGWVKLKKKKDTFRNLKLEEKRNILDYCVHFRLKKKQQNLFKNNTIILPNDLF